MPRHKRRRPRYGDAVRITWAGDDRAPVDCYGPTWDPAGYVGTVTGRCRKYRHGIHATGNPRSRMDAEACIDPERVTVICHKTPWQSLLAWLS